MVFSNICTGAGSRAELTRPHFPTATSTSGMRDKRLSRVCMYSRFFSMLEWGMLVGISRKDPSFREGINSFPVPGKVFFAACHPAVCLKVFHPNCSAPEATKPKLFPKPSQTINPNSRVTTGMIRNLNLFANA